MKKWWPPLAIILIIGGIWFAVFYWQNLRGIAPAIEPPPQDIAELLAASRNLTDTPLVLPPGFSISIFADGLGKPRVMQWDPVGNLLVSIPSEGRVLALSDSNGDGVADRTTTVVDNLNHPHGLAFDCRTICKLYVAETDALARYDYDSEALQATGRERLVSLPPTGEHVTRTIMFLPTPRENILLISVGSSCNACNERDPRRAKIWAYEVDGAILLSFASGLRNAVFMALHPVTGEVWASEMGRDFLGDDLPPDEINIIEEGKNYGWPLCYGKNVHDTDFDKNIYIRDPCADMIPSRIDIPAHSAPLGLAFIPEEGWPEDWWHDLIVAYHGSWNRSEPTGYKLVRYKLDAQGNYLGEEDFITGWLTDQGALGRPVDILIQPGGVMYISDDTAGVIYRVTR